MHHPFTILKMKLSVLKCAFWQLLKINHVCHLYRTVYIKKSFKK